MLSSLERRIAISVPFSCGKAFWRLFPNAWVIENKLSSMLRGFLLPLCVAPTLMTNELSRLNNNTLVNSNGAKEGYLTRCSTCIRTIGT